MRYSLAAGTAEGMTTATRTTCPTHVWAPMKTCAAGSDACHKMGVRDYFFVNYQQAMIESDWYKNELSRYVEMYENGGHRTEGFAMGTLWARMGHPKLMTFIDTAYPAYRDALIRQFLKLVEIGADGVHVDKMFPTAIDYNPNSPMSPDTATWEGAIRLTQDIMRECRKADPDCRHVVRVQLGPDAGVQRRHLVGGEHVARATLLPGDGGDAGGPCRL